VTVRYAVASAFAAIGMTARRSPRVVVKAVPDVAVTTAETRLPRARDAKHNVALPASSQ
jgi:hypothetical protein